MHPGGPKLSGTASQLNTSNNGVWADFEMRFALLGELRWKKSAKCGVSEAIRIHGTVEYPSARSRGIRRVKIGNMLESHSLERCVNAEEVLVPFSRVIDVCPLTRRLF